MLNNRLKLILSDQLNYKHSWLKKCKKNDIYVMMELKEDTNYVLQHSQKIIASFAAMRSFAKFLKEKGNKVHYIKINHHDSANSIISNLDKLIGFYDIKTFYWQNPDNYLFDKKLDIYTNQLKINVIKSDSEHFYSERNEAKFFFKNKKRWIMEYFYRYMRKKHNILMNKNKKPEGGKWNYDCDNRKIWKDTIKIPVNKRKIYNYSKIWNEIKNAGIKSFGNSLNGYLQWPVTRNEVIKKLSFFIKKNLINFGPYQDIMTKNNYYIFHSLLSFSLNIKLISPKEIIKNVIKYYLKNNIPLSSIEGFIRQILGWREYIRGVYWAKMPNYLKNNFFNHNNKLPNYFWDGNTKMNCMNYVLKQSLNFSYAHHIQRLMIIGNFLLLSNISVKEIHKWFLGVYIDAFEWVELPNTLGISQYFDGGILATKPYVSSANYISKMSDYCKNCFYNKNKKYGHLSCPYNSLYWDFFINKRSKLIDNKRLSMVYYQLDKHHPNEINKIKNYAAYLRKNLNKL